MTHLNYHATDEAIALTGTYGEAVGTIAYDKGRWRVSFAHRQYRAIRHAFSSLEAAKMAALSEYLELRARLHYAKNSNCRFVLVSARCASGAGRVFPGSRS